MSIDAQSFWNFSLGIYAHGSVKENSLKFQDEYSFNVNLLLFLLYLYKTDIKIDSTTLQITYEAISELDARTTAFREHRRALKSASEKQYKEALQKELAMEKEIQATLVNAFNGQQPPLSPALPRLHDAIETALKVIHRNAPGLSRELKSSVDELALSLEGFSFDD